MVDWLTPLLGAIDWATWIYWVAPILIGLSVFLAAYAMLQSVVPRGDPLKERRTAVGLGTKPQESGPRGLTSNREPATLRERVVMFFVPRDEKSQLVDQARLRKAGYRTAVALGVYYAVRISMMLLLPLLTLMIARIFFPGKNLSDLYPYLAAAVALGMVGPSILLDKLVDRRLRKLRNAVPDVLDLLVVCTESGLGINAALLRVNSEIRFIHPEFAAELSLVNGEIRAGLDRDQALLNLIERTGLEDIKTLVALLIQSLRFGTSVADTLRIYSEEFRDKRMQAAEEEAAKLATKMIFPMAFCFMPAFFVVAVGPAMASLMKALKF